MLVSIHYKINNGDGYETGVVYILHINRLTLPYQLDVPDVVLSMP